MLKNEINLTLLSIIKNKKALKNFYKTGHFSYSKDKKFEGAVAIVNDKAIVSFLQPINDDSKIIATAAFKDNTTIILQLNGKDFSKFKFGNLHCRFNSNLESVINDISSVRKHCDNAKEISTSINTSFIKTIFYKTSQSSDRKLSKQDVKFLLQTTIDKLEKTKTLHIRNEVSPKIESSFDTTITTSNINHSTYDKTLEI